MSTDELGPILGEVTAACRDSAAKHAFQLLRPHVIERDHKRIRFGVLDGADAILNAMEILIARGHAEYLGRVATDELEESVLARLRIRQRSSAIYVNVYVMSAETWAAFIAATMTNEPPDSGQRAA